MPTKTPDKPAAKKSDPRDTPAMRQYARFKAQHPDCVLLFRMGDFYELFDDDAVVVSRALGLTLTQRGNGIPMAGVPHHAVEGYVRRLVEQGFRIAMCDQVQDPKDAKGIVERAVTRVITPGTLVDAALLDDDATNNLVAIHFRDGDDRIDLAVVEVSTGTFTLFDKPSGAIADALAQLGACEVVYDGDDERARRIADAATAVGCALTPRPGWQFRAAEAQEAIRKQYNVNSVEGWGLAKDDPAIAAIGALVRYLHETQLTHERERAGGGDAGALTHLQAPTRQAEAGRMQVDGATLRALEVERTIRDGQTSGSLLGVFLGGARSMTPMGRRLLRRWLCAPLASIDAIGARQACVAALVDDVRMAQELRDALGGVQDVARIAGRFGMGRATPRDLPALGASLERAGAILGALGATPAFALDHERLAAAMSALAPIAQEITRACVDAPPAHLREGGLFADGYDAALDESRSLGRDAHAWLAKYQARIAKEHDLPNVKVGYNRVFGYYIELPGAQAKRAPAIFMRKQTLKNAERYITPELKEFEDKAQSAQASAVAREQELFDGLCASVRAQTDALAAFADAVARIDALLRFADIARRRGWVRPEIVEEPALDAAQARHPVLEATLGEGYVPNDIVLGTADEPARLALITGPNMSGKSTHIRTAALLTLLAHTGSFVPADSATIGLTDKLFTRVGADDALHAGQSTFMVEMTETARILHGATHRSLVVLDEIGRGTSTLDGLSLAWAIAERMAATDLGARTLFATHYHELTQLEESAPGRVRNLHVAVREWNDEVVFLHRILPGRTNRSYGIHVARLAGVPERVIGRAQELLESLTVSHEGGHEGVNASGPEGGPPASAGGAPGASGNTGRFESQMSLFAPAPSPIVERLNAVRIESMTPLEAFDALRELKGLLEDLGG
ncbi:MAG: DNA mismatch repair protein MutS [Phycisphaeraceae bacterium]|nr:DNA mismatch repair protein MutS [Phycisphaeraceae bacterium]